MRTHSVAHAPRLSRCYGAVLSAITGYPSGDSGRMDEQAPQDWQALTWVSHEGQCVAGGGIYTRVVKSFAVNG